MMQAVPVGYQAYAVAPQGCAMGYPHVMPPQHGGGGYAAVYPNHGLPLQQAGGGGVAYAIGLPAQPQLQPTDQRWDVSPHPGGGGTPQYHLQPTDQRRDVSPHPGGGGTPQYQLQPTDQRWDASPHPGGGGTPQYNFQIGLPPAEQRRDPPAEQRRDLPADQRRDSVEHRRHSKEQRRDPMEHRRDASPRGVGGGAPQYNFQVGPPQAEQRRDRRDASPRENAGGMPQHGVTAQPNAQPLNTLPCHASAPQLRTREQQPISQQRDASPRHLQRVPQQHECQQQSFIQMAGHAGHCQANVQHASNQQPDLRGRHATSQRAASRSQPQGSRSATPQGGRDATPCPPVERRDVSPRHSSRTLAPHGAGRFRHPSHGGQPPVQPVQQPAMIPQKQKVAMPPAQPQQKAPQPQPLSRQVTEMQCGEGHVMQAKVVREVWNKVSWWHYQTDCDVCGRRITSNDGRYYCKECKYSVCLTCSAERLARDPATAHVKFPPTSALYGAVKGCSPGPERALPGDIILCGPDKWGIHHCVLVVGMMQRDPEAAQMIRTELPELEAMDIFSCHTIECSASSQGNDFLWYPANNYFARDRKTGAASMVADIPDGDQELCFVSNRPQVKLLLHPCRPGHKGPPFNMTAFKKVVDACSQTSKSWSITTGAKGFFNRRNTTCRLQKENYPDAGSRKELLEEIHQRWENRPICTSVVIMVWQRYFEAIAGKSPQAPDAAVQNILRFMPLLSDKTLPSALIKELSTCGWVIRGNLDA